MGGSLKGGVRAERAMIGWQGERKLWEGWKGCVGRVERFSEGTQLKRWW